MKINKTIKMSKKGVKVTFKTKNDTWYGEFTNRDYERGYGWSQWGSSTRNLSYSQPELELAVKCWIKLYKEEEV